MKRGKRRLRSLRQACRLERLHDDGQRDGEHRGNAARTPRNALEPPAPPLALTPALAADPETDIDILWHIAREAPELRRWLVANPKADARLLEYVSQAGGPGVRRALNVLLDSLDDPAGA
ncbi:hypothetical protein KIH75_05765 [Bifidobacterium sp. 64T4]|uniref:variant leucine-rich repeat-containing protein n=1 Tax=Bifidobacterium pongonis TaxID=2834432 RepID=UPI001C55B30A|nr:hypothetical protein [Bifidobacterium pongonis]MBW3094848.1 hypothetical protein [Bifidobacterium pongonis]